jgi:hypothetical protein
MKNGQIVTCASCRKYPLHEATQNGGKALCPEFEVERPFDYRPCPLHMAASDTRHRKALLEQLTNKG